MASLRSQIFELLEDTGRDVVGDRLEQNPITFATERLGTRRVAEILGVTQRSVQRYAKGERGAGGEVRSPRGARALAMATVSRRELRRAGADAIGRGTVVVRGGSVFVLCYEDEPQGKPRELRQDYAIEVGEWLEHFYTGAAAEARGDRYAAEAAYSAMEDAFTEELFSAYGITEGGDMSICEGEADLDLVYEAS